MLNCKYSKSRKFFLLPALLFLPPAIYAADFQSPDAIRQSVKDFVMKNALVDSGETVDVDMTQSSSSLHLSSCSQSVDVQLPESATPDKISAVEVRCSGVKPWHTYMPVNVKIFAKILVAKHTLQPNEMITVDDVDTKVYDKNSLYNGYFKDPKEIEGRTVTHVISPGAVFTQRNLMQTMMVHREQAVDIIARHNSIVVTMKGISKSDGVLNQAVKVYNPSSKRILDAIVVGPNQAEVV